MLTPEQRRLRAQLAAHTRWSKPGSRAEHGAKIRASKLDHYARRVDPEGRLDPAERRQLAESALRADMTRLAFQGAKARARTAGAR